MRLYGLVGYPLSHSFSKNYFTEKFNRENILDCRYENFPLRTIEELPSVIAMNPLLDGLNVTIPYKEAVLQFLAGQNDLVRATGACNCIKIINEKLIGFNTDVIGFEKSLLQKLEPWHNHALILGTGGASRAVEFVLKKRDISLKKVSRHPSPDGLTYDQLTPEIVQENLLIINASPVGMYPNIQDFPKLPYEGVTAKHLVIDLIYNPEKTLFLKKSEENGAVIQNGYDMLIEQAEESWRIWNDPTIL